jgi:hypothetical protein
VAVVAAVQAVVAVLADYCILVVLDWQKEVLVLQ